MKSIAILHGYLLDGSGSNLWTQSVVRSFCRTGVDVHLVCQEPHPEQFDFVNEAIRYDDRSLPTTIFEQQTPYPGRCVMHKPALGGVLPVYVEDKYEEFERVVPMVQLDDEAIEDYLARNQRVLDRVVAENELSALLANHAVLMSVVARRVAAAQGIPFAIMPHGSALEYAVKQDERFMVMARGAFDAATRLLVIGDAMRKRVEALFGELPGIDEKMTEIRLGVDTDLFLPAEPAARHERIDALKSGLDGLARGKTPASTRTMTAALHDGLTRDEWAGLIESAGAYNGKLPDADCESKLDEIDWAGEKIVLYVGRLIAAKGIQAVVAALPSILEQAPETRLVVVGHGPMREVLETLLHAMEHGDRELLTNVLDWGDEPLLHVQRYLAQLDSRGELEAYLAAARKHRVSRRVVFTGYLVHQQLQHLFACSDVAVFPSIVAEAGPLVFLEALASGVLPMGIDQAGIAASIRSLSSRLPAEVTEMMKLRGDPDHLVADIVSHGLLALALGRECSADLRRAAVERNDWKAVAAFLLSVLTAEKACPRQA